MRLTAKSVEAAHAGEKRVEIADSIMPGLYLIVQPVTQRKSWAARFRLGGKTHKHTIGAYPVFTLQQARDAASAVLRSVSEGRSPKQAKVETVQAAVTEFLTRHGKRYRASSLGDVQRRLARLGPIEGRKLNGIIKGDIRAILDKIDAPVECNRTHSIFRAFFRWCVENDYIASSPVAGIKRPNDEQSRDRVLSDVELAEVWRAADKAEYPLNQITKLLILTGARRNEVFRMRWDEINLDAGTWTLPASRTKNGKQHVVMLPHQALDILRSTPHVGARYVFTLNGHIPYNNSRAQEKLGVELAEHWVFHDLRRTVATGLQRLGVRLEVTEAVLNHVSGSRSGIVGIYQRHAFQEEGAVALQLWADRIDDVVRS